MTISATTQGLRPGVCTSSNRPVTPFEGQMIYETDTDLTYVYGGSAWQQVAGGTAVGNSGLVYITSATATSGTVINLTSVFSSTYDNYRVVVSSYRPSSGNGITVQLGTGSATNTGYYWGGIWLSAYTAAPTVNAHGGANVANFETSIIGDATNDGGGSIEIYSPNLARNTMIVAQPIDGRVASGTPRLPHSGYQSATTQFTSLHLGATTGFLNVVVTVYGYRK